MMARAKANEQRTIILAHQIEAMAREKKLRPLDHYLATEKPKSLSSGKTMLAMLKRFKLAQDKRVTRAA